MTSTPLLHIEDIVAGQPLPELVKRPSAAMLFRFSAVTWNTHRIHYDAAFARSEGHADVLVQATMHGAFLLEMVTAFAGDGGRVQAFEYSNRGKASPGDVLTLGGTVKDIDLEHCTVACELWERNQAGNLCAIGTARVQLPMRA